MVPLVTASSIYEVPLMLEDAGLGDFLVEKLGLGARAGAPELSEWRALVERIHAEKPFVRIALVGKYVELHDAYLSVVESLTHAGWSVGVDTQIDWIDSQKLETDWEEYEPRLAAADGIIVPGGFGHRGIEGKIRAAGYARTHNIPYLGLCLGLQVAVIEFARDVLGLTQANSGEFDENSPDKVIDLMPNQRQVSDMGGTMRLGQWVCCLTPESKTEQAYGTAIIFERHRHRYEVNIAYHKRLQEARACASAASRRTTSWWRSSSYPTIRGSWRRSSTRNSRAARRARIRCSVASSPPASSAPTSRPPSGWPVRPAPRTAATATTVTPARAWRRARRRGSKRFGEVAAMNGRRTDGWA